MQRKQARTGEEREEEEEEQISESESEDEENEIIYNPKNLPLGWDGKVRPLARRRASVSPWDWPRTGHPVTALAPCLPANSLLALQAPRVEHQLQL